MLSDRLWPRVVFARSGPSARGRSSRRGHSNGAIQGWNALDHSREWRHGAELSGLVIRHGLFGFFPAVHHERSDLHDRLVDGRATNRDKSYRAG